MMRATTAIAVHGGAGTFSRRHLTPDVEKEYLSALTDAVEKAHRLLATGYSALDAVELAVTLLEDCPLFNAGKGAVFTHEGLHEMDAAIMCGKTLDAGSVAAVRSIKNPIKGARIILQNSEHIMLSGAGAETYLNTFGIETESDDYFHTPNRYNQWLKARETDKSFIDHTTEHKFGTVGAVAVDADGNLAAATSTGGMTNKKFGRIGDSPIIGSGTYANNSTCAVSCTGHGEFFMRTVLAYDISCRMQLSSLTLAQAARQSLNILTKIGGEGGFIAVDNRANISMIYNCEGMYRAMKKGRGKATAAIFEQRNRKFNSI